MNSHSRQLGRSDLSVHPIGLGCMSFFSKENAEELVAEALHLGVNFFDTADLYNQGQNEEWLGAALKMLGARHNVVLATKVGNRWEPGKPGWTWGPTKEYILKAVKDSLQRLQTDYIDLYQLHGGTLDDPIDDILEAFEHLKADGLIRHYGISSIRPNVIREYVKRSNISTVMMQYSLLDRRPEETILDMLHNEGIGVIARGPMAKGWLSTTGRSGTITAGADPAAGGAAIVSRSSADAGGYLDYSTEEILQLRKKLSSNPSESDLTDIALGYVLSHPAVSVAIPGASNSQQLRDNLRRPPNELLSGWNPSDVRPHLKPQRYESHR